MASGITHGVRRRRILDRTSASGSAESSWDIRISFQAGTTKMCAKHLSGTGRGRPFMEIWRHRKDRSSSFTKRGLVRRGSMVQNGTSPVQHVRISAESIFELRAECQPTGSKPRQITGGVGFPHAPKNREQFSRDSMSGIGGIYGMGHHPFVLGFQGILFASQGGQSSAENDIFEQPISSFWQLQTSRSWAAFFIGAAGLAFKPDAAVFPEFAFGFESPGGVEIGQQGQSSNGSDAGQFFPFAKNRFASNIFPQLFPGQCHLGFGGVESDPEHLQLPGEGWDRMAFEPGFAAAGGVNHVGGDVQAKEAGSGPDTAGVLGVVLNVSMVQADPLFQLDAPVVITVIDGPEEAAAEEGGNLGGVDGVVLVAIGGDEAVSTGIADDELVDVGAEVSAQPAGQGAFLEGEAFDALKGIKDPADVGDGGRDGVSGLNPAIDFNGDFSGVAVHVGSDIIGCHDGSFRMGLFAQ
jgi:hypothetical protein